jgi:ubiquitin-conjugating enzyme E2 D/E
MTDKAANRISNELKQLTQKPIPGVTIGPVGNDLFALEGTVIGPADSPYATGIFKVSIAIPPNYPFTEPLVLMKTPIYHPGVGVEGEDNGRVCMEGLLGKKWAPTLGVRHLMEGFPALLADPKRSTNPLRNDLANELASNPAEFTRKAQEFTRAHAH